jgi:hypothetical protein
MKDFASFLRNIKTEKVAPVKIAIIDDGIDATLDSLQGKIAGGTSFCPYPNSTDLMNAYFVPSGRHGTLMASLICQICPDPRLYIARLEERPAVDGNDRRITAKSAAKVKVPSQGSTPSRFNIE